MEQRTGRIFEIRSDCWATEWAKQWLKTGVCQLPNEDGGVRITHEQFGLLYGPELALVLIRKSDLRCLIDTKPNAGARPSAPSADPSTGTFPPSDHQTPPGQIDVKEKQLRAGGEAAIRSPEQPQQPRVRGRPARDRAARAIQALYPDGVPDQVTLPNAILCRSVGDWLKVKSLPNVRDATILRAAGRRK